MAGKHKTTKNTRAFSRLRKRFAPLAIIALVLGTALYSYAATPPKAPQPTAKISHHPVAAKSSKPAAPAPKPVQTPAPAPAPAPAAPKVAPAPKPAPPAPAPAPVVPAPDSSVNNLAPTSTPTTPVSTTPPADSDTTTQTQSDSSSATSSPVAPAASYTSTNWSGYLSAGGHYTAVSASWIAPTAKGNGTTESGDAAWIGIGGVTSDDLIQIGTENIIEPDGTVYSGAFYELLPDVSQEVPGVTVAPGDAISASISQVSATKWSMSISNQTTGQSYTATVTYTSTNSSAEWIEEDPSYASGGLVPFDNFGTINFTGASTTVNGTAMSISGAQGSNITMVAGPSRTVVAQPSALGASGTGFSVTRKGL